MRSPDELRALAEAYVADLALTPELHGQAESVRYALVGGKRVRAVICLATAEAAGAEPEAALPAAAALELVHAFSLVHDDLPALDNDGERRGRPSAWAKYGEATAVLAGDALLAEAFRLALSYPTPAGRPRAGAGDARDDRRPVPRHDRERARRPGRARAEDGPPLRGLGRHAPCGSPEVPERDQAPWRAFGEELGLLFQFVDDILDGDGYVRDARRGRRAAAGGRGGGARASVPRCGPGRHVGARRHRRRARNTDVVSTPAARSVARRRQREGRRRQVDGHAPGSRSRCAAPRPVASASSTPTSTGRTSR